MKSILILIAYVAAVWMQSILRNFHAYRVLYGMFPYYLPETFKAFLAVGLCVLLARALYGKGDHFLMRQGFSRGLLFGFVASLPMLLAFALTRQIHTKDAIGATFLAVWFPLGEEVISRGFAFRLLYERERWRWWMASAIVAAVTGAAHIEKSQTSLEVLGLFAYTAAGAGILCWLLARWQSMWFPFWLHCCMNLWWEVFSVSRIALGGWFPFVAQTVVLVAAVVITVKMTPSLSLRGNEPDLESEDVSVDRSFHCRGLSARGECASGVSPRVLWSPTVLP